MVNSPPAEGPASLGTPVPFAFDEVYREYSPSILGYLTAHGIDDPEGVTHDVFLALFPRINSLRGGIEGVRTLLFSIAHARYVDYQRRRTRTPDLVEYDPGSDARVSESAEDSAMRATESADALRILSLLNEDQREVLLLRVVADLPLDRVAGIMNKSVGAIKQLQRRALLVLQEHPAVELWRSR
ncbi:RNA polymerase sigma factor [Parafrigoribacterium soli]|uniref:RNA polymerase sigma factor n=1 Tax=Parafrigoribacterium soli TaxID=3144663 RepID=UPI0032ED3265